MNRDEIIRMAREAGWQYAHGDSGYEPLWAFATLVAEHEREACAKVCEEQQELVGAEMCCVAMNCATAIRTRGQV